MVKLPEHTGTELILTDNVNYVCAIYQYITYTVSCGKGEGLNIYNNIIYLYVYT